MVWDVKMVPRKGIKITMPDDLKTAKSALTKVHQDMDALNRLANPSYLRVIKQMERTMEPIRRHQLEISRAMELSGAAARIKDIIGANQHWQDMLNQATTTSRILENMNAVHQSWFERIKPIQHDFSRLQASAKLALCDVSFRLTATERIFAGIDFETFKTHFQIEMPAISDLERSIFNVTASYESLADSLKGLPDITQLPSFILPGATREIYTTGYALESLRPWDEREEEDVDTEIQLIAEAELESAGCIALLQKVDPNLARPYIGARDALSGNNTDRARHILSSLRELWSHLLRRLAPEDRVIQWIPENNNHDYLHEGRPTRRARVLYICRNLNNDPLTEFLAHDTRALVKLIDLFNRVHELETKLTDEQLRAIVLKTDSWLMYILQIWAGSDDK